MPRATFPGALDPTWFEAVPCYECGSGESSELLIAQDDLTGLPGNFRFVRCRRCGLAYQDPRLSIERVKAYYDDRYISHRRREDWGLLTPLYRRAMEAHDRRKEAIALRHGRIGPGSEVLDVGCGAGTFLTRLRERHGVRAAAVDFKDMTFREDVRAIEFHLGLFYEQDLGRDRFDLVTMWHFLEHDYDPIRSLRHARDALRPDGRLVIEVPRLDSLTARLFGDRWPGLQAPQHTVLLDRAHLMSFLSIAGLEVVEYLPWGAFPPWFYVFAGVAFRLLKGKGLDVERAMLPYFAAQLAFLPVLLLERRLNLAMQTVIARRA